MYKGLSIFILCILSIFSTTDLNAQRFKAGLILGVNAAQINGDASAGFNRLGFSTGIRGVAVLGEKSELSLEMLYSQRGSQTELIKAAGIPQLKIKLTYVEVPILWNYKDWLVEDEDYYKVQIHTGASFSRLIDSSVEDSAIALVQDEFKENELSYIIGATFYANEHLGFTARYSRAITRLYNFDVNGSGPQLERPLTSFFLNFHTLYMF